MLAAQAGARSAGGCSELSHVSVRVTPGLEAIIGDNSGLQVFRTGSMWLRAGSHCCRGKAGLGTRQISAPAICHLQLQPIEVMLMELQPESQLGPTDVRGVRGQDSTFQSLLHKIESNCPFDCWDLFSWHFQIRFLPCASCGI